MSKQQFQTKHDWQDSKVLQPKPLLSSIFAQHYHMYISACRLMQVRELTASAIHKQCLCILLQLSAAVLASLSHKPVLHCNEVVGLANSPSGKEVGKI